MKKLIWVVGAALMFIGMAAGDSITMDGTGIACMIAPAVMIASGAGVMFLTREEAR